MCRSHLDIIRREVASHPEPQTVAAQDAPQPPAAAQRTSPASVPAREHPLPGPPLRSSSGRLMREQSIPQDSRWGRDRPRSPRPAGPADTGMDIEEGELTRPAAAASPRTSEAGSRVLHPAPSHASAGTPCGKSAVVNLLVNHD